MNAKKLQKKKPFILKKDAIIQELDGKLAIFDAEQSSLYTFNETGSLIFKKMRAGWDKEKIILYISKKYSINKQRAERDFESFIKLLMGKDILKV